LEAAVRLYLDENLSPRIAIQLQQRGVDTVSVRDLDVLGDDDISHLERATCMGRVLVTTDVDFLRLATTGAQHSGVPIVALSIYERNGWADATTVPWLSQLEFQPGAADGDREPVPAGKVVVVIGY
jgi:hypothetical protein